MARSRLYPPSVDPGFPALPVRPSGWRRVTFSDIVDVVERPTKLQPEQPYKLVTARRNRGGIALRGELLGREILTKTQYTATAGDFLISRRQIIHGACGVVPADLDGAIVSNEYSTLRARRDLLMPFFEHYSHTPYFQRTCFHSSHGVDVEKMIFKIDEWLRREVDVPPLPEQRKIAAILSSVDDAIEATREVIDQLQVVKKAVMTELLTRGIPGRHTKFKMTEIGEVPEEWEITSIGDLGDFSGGNGFRPPDWGVNGLPIIRIQNLNGSLEFNYFAGDPDSDWLVEPGALLFAWAGTRGASFGPCIWPGPLGVLNQHIHRIRPRTLVRKQYLFRLLSLITQAVEKKAHGFKDSLVHLRKAELTSWPVALPPLGEQDETVGVLNSIDARVDAEDEFLLGLRDAKSALMSVLLTGEVRVTPDEEAAA